MQNVGIIGGLIWLAILIIGGIGWIMNIVKIMAHIGEPLTAVEVFRCIAVFFFPVGAALGYF